MDPWYQQPGVLATVAYTVLTAFIAWYMRRQASLQKQLTSIQIFYSFVKRMEATRADRAKLRAYVQQQRATGQPITMLLPPDVEEAADRVCREYDVLGLLDRRGLVDRRLVDEFYSVPLASLYKDILATYLNYIRDASRRGPTHFWELANFAERVRYVPENHPATRRLAAWPSDPRRAPTAYNRVDPTQAPRPLSGQPVR